MKRTHRREFVMNDDEARDLAGKARCACMTESGLIRMLISGYQPPPHPDKEFFNDINRLLESSDRLIEAAKYAGESGGGAILTKEANELRTLRIAIERKYLTRKETDVWR